MGKRFKRFKGIGLFNNDFRLDNLSKLGDPLERLDPDVDFELFRELLTNGLAKLGKMEGFPMITC